MKLNDKVYDVLKWVVMVVLPAAATFYVAMSKAWGWPYATEIVSTIAAVETLLGALIGVSTAQYNADKNKEA